MSRFNTESNASLKDVDAPKQMRPLSRFGDKSVMILQRAPLKGFVKALGKEKLDAMYLKHEAAQLSSLEGGKPMRLTLECLKSFTLGCKLPFAVRAREFITAPEYKGRIGTRDDFKVARAIQGRLLKELFETFGEARYEQIYTEGVNDYVGRPPKPKGIRPLVHTVPSSELKAREPLVGDERDLDAFAWTERITFGREPGLRSGELPPSNLLKRDDALRARYETKPISVEDLRAVITMTGHADELRDGMSETDVRALYDKFVWEWIDEAGERLENE